MRSEQTMAQKLLNSVYDGNKLSTQAVSLNDEAAAYALQDEYFGIAAKNGINCLGYKIALTSAASQKLFGAEEPAYGRILSNRCLACGDVLELSTEDTVKVECEMAVVIKEDITQVPQTRKALLKHIDYAIPAIEVVSSRYESTHNSLLHLIADNSNFAAVVLGDTPIELEGLETDLLGIRLEVNGELRNSGVSSAVMGDPLNALIWLIKKLNTHGKCLNKGNIVLTGAWMKPEIVQKGDVFRADFDELGNVSALFCT